MSASKVIKNANNKLNSSKISALFFDLDNTLIPTRKGDSKACRKLSEQLEMNHGFSTDEAENSTKLFLQSFRSCPDNPQTTLDSWRSYLWNQALPDRYKHLSDSIYRHWLQLRYRYLAISPDYELLLKRFRSAGYLLALITNGPSNAQWEKINKLNVKQYFDCILVSADLPWEKPHPNIFIAACNLLNVKPNECCMIGDKIETDIQGGKAANLGATIWIPLSAEKLHDYEADEGHDERRRPDLIVQNLSEMYKHFPNVNSGNNGGGSGSHDSSGSSSSSSSSQARRYSSHAGAHNNGYLPTTSRKYHQYRRGFSLPEIDSCNSENSSDSVFS